MSTRQPMLAELAAIAMLGGRAWAIAATLRAGDQKGGAQSLMQAAGVLDGLPYLLEWRQFASAAADRYLAAGIIHDRLNAEALFDASFDHALTE